MRFNLRVLMFVFVPVAAILSLHARNYILDISRNNAVDEVQYGADEISRGLWNEKAIYYEGGLPCVTYDESGRVLYSWRAIVMMKQSRLCPEYDFSTPWDSAANRRMWEPLRRTDLTPDQRVQWPRFVHPDGKSPRWLAITGPGSTWAVWNNTGSRAQRNSNAIYEAPFGTYSDMINDFPGTSQRIRGNSIGVDTAFLVVEVNPSDAVWCEPVDTTLKEIHDYFHGKGTGRFTFSSKGAYITNEGGFQFGLEAAVDKWFKYEKAREMGLR